jgi:hypothetical protein
MSIAEAERTRLEAVLRRPDYSDRDFMAAIKSLAASPESFASALRDKASNGRFSMTDLLPGSAEYWDNLTASYGGSATLQDFIASELAEQHVAALRDNPTRVLATISLTFGSPTLIPRDLLGDVAPDVVLAAVVDDPFALCGALDLCAERAAADGRFVTVGTQILQKLFGHMKRLELACDIFAAVFVIATAHLAVHETLRQRPVTGAGSQRRAMLPLSCGLSASGAPKAIPCCHGPIELGGKPIICRSLTSSAISLAGGRTDRAAFPYRRRLWTGHGLMPASPGH